MSDVNIPTTPKPPAPALPDGLSAFGLFGPLDVPPPPPPPEAA